MGKTLTAGHLEALGIALCEVFHSQKQLEDLLLEEKLDKRFDHLASRSDALLKNAHDIVRVAYAEGWVQVLLETARTKEPDAPALRALWESLPEADAAHAPAIPQRADRPSLLCGRAAQWSEVCQVAPAPRHQVMLVHGAQGQEPLHFRARIQTWLMPDPRRSMLEVVWNSRPASDLEFEAALATAFGVSPTQLKTTLFNRLAAQNLVLLHDCLTVKLDDDNVVQYYTEWLPRLLKESPHRGRLKCVQPLQWATAGGGPAWKRLFSAGAPPTGRDRKDVIALIAKLRDRHSDDMPVIEIDELLDVTEQELRNFVENSGLTRKQQQALLQQLLACPQVPATIFETIDANWNQIQAIS